MWQAWRTGAGVLTWQECKERVAKKRKRYSRLAYATEIEERKDGYALVYHGSDIITYYPDGAVQVDTCGWSSNCSTHTRVNEHQNFIQLWNHGTYHRPVPRDNVRFGSKQQGWSANERHGYPWPGKLLCEVGKSISGLQDRFEIIDPAMKKERRERSKALRRAMGVRLVLGEFDEQVLSHQSDGWTYYKQNSWDDRQEGTDALAHLFLTRATHNEINNQLTRYAERTEVLSFGRRRYSSRNSLSLYDDRTGALNAFINYVVRYSVLRGDRTDRFVNYPGVVL